MTHPRILAFLNARERPRLVIFDKDGTLIDFNAMWASWIVELARRLEAAAGLPLAERLFGVMGFDPVAGRVLAGSHLALDPLAELRELTAATVRQAGLPGPQAARAVERAWYTPDPVALAKPLADLPALLGALRARGIYVAVATSDNHAPAAATLAGLGLAGLVDAIVGADDGVPIKPAPDMILKLCQELGVAPAQAAMVGDAVDDLKMGRAAGAGLVVGVLSGLAPAALLAPYADALLPSVAELIDTP